MRVLHVQRVKGIGGSERHLLALLPELHARGIEMHMSVLCIGDGMRFVDEIRAAGIETTVVRGRGHFQPELVPQLRVQIRSFRPDVVHTHLVDADLYGQIAAAITRVPGVSSVHGTPAFYRREPYRSAGRIAGRLARRRIAISRHVARFVAATRLAPQERIRVIPYGIDVADEASPRENGSAVRTQLGWGAEQYVVGIVARLIPGKGHARLLDAIESATLRNPDVRLLVVGDGPVRPELESCVRAHAIEDLVRMVGFVDDVGPYMDACDVVAVPTEPELSEGFGLSALEAMAAGKPVIATDVGSLPEVVVDGVTGLVVHPSSTLALGNAIVQLAADPAASAAFGTAGRARAKHEFPLGRMVDSTIAVYEEIA